jgi:uncharacterized protein (DUF885 family)
MCACLLGRPLLAAAPPAALSALLTAYYEDYLPLFPLEAAINGDNDARYEKVWPNDLSAEHRAKVDALGRIDRATLTGTDLLSYDMLKWNLPIRREGTR